jgi:hypothetical protein
MTGHYTGSDKLKKTFITSVIHEGGRHAAFSFGLSFAHAMV